MKYTLGIDTSNYASSAALFSRGENGGSDRVVMDRQMLTVSDGGLGLRQSDAVFQHVNRLSEVIKGLVRSAGDCEITSVGVSVRPRNINGSYMPCFMVGKLVAQSVSAALGVDCYEFSHQEGHIAAALYSSGSMALIGGEFYAFHVSGGTTELLLVNKSRQDGFFDAEIIGRSLDLKAGQAIDRAGNMLSLEFPSGKFIDELSLKCDEHINVKPTLKGLDCCLSGIENQTKKLINAGKSREYIAKFCIKSVEAAVCGMLDAAFSKFGEKPVVFAGGVMSNSIINRSMTEKLGKNAHFAAPEFSADNAAGVAVLTDLCRQAAR